MTVNTLHEAGPSTLPPQEADISMIKTPELGNDAMTGFNDQLDRLVEVVPEAEANRELITRGATELIETFQIEPQFFEDQDRSFVFMSLAQRAAKLQDQKEQERTDGDFTELNRQSDFIASATFLLTDKYSNANRDLSERHNDQKRDGFKDNEASDRITDKVLTDYTDTQITAELNEFIDQSSLFQEVRDRLGIVDDGDPVETRALSVGNYPSNYFAREPNGVTISDIWQWEKGMLRRSADFANKLEDGDLILKAAGFKVVLDGKKYIYLPSSSAEQLMAEKNGIVLTDLEGRTKRVKGTIQHEYTHTQHNVDLDNGFGLSLEERRAEHFSGNTSDYINEKRFFNHLSVLFGGKHVTDMFDEISADRRAGKETSIYALLARDYGIDTVIEIAAALPNIYKTANKSDMVGDMLGSLGSFDDIVKRTADIVKPNRATVKEDLLRRLEKMGATGVDNEYLEYYFEPILKTAGISMDEVRPE